MVRVSEARLFRKHASTCLAVQKLHVLHRKVSFCVSRALSRPLSEISCIQLILLSEGARELGVGGILLARRKSKNCRTSCSSFRASCASPRPLARTHRYTRNDVSDVAAYVFLRHVYYTNMSAVIRMLLQRAPLLNGTIYHTFC